MTQAAPCAILNDGCTFVVELNRQMALSVRTLRPESRGGGGMKRSSWIIGFLVLLSLFVTIRPVTSRSLWRSWSLM